MSSFLLFSPVIVDVKLQNLKANHNDIIPALEPVLPVIVYVKLQNLKVNSNDLCDGVEVE